MYLEQKSLTDGSSTPALKSEVGHIKLDTDQCFYSVLQDDLILAFS